MQFLPQCGSAFLEAESKSGFKCMLKEQFHNNRPSTLAWQGW